MALVGIREARMFRRSIPTLLIVAFALAALEACSPAPATPSTITVAGTVQALGGAPLSGVPVAIVDATGPRPYTATANDGTFTIADVTPPYSLSAVPNASSGLVPETWSPLDTAHPVLTLSNDTGDPASTNCPAATAHVTGTLSQAVGSGDTGEVVFLAPGLAITQPYSFASANLAAGDTSFDITVSFDPTLCPDQTTGTLIYLEYPNPPLVAVDTAQLGGVTATAGTTLSGQALDVQPAAFVTVQGTVGFPSGIANATLHGLVGKDGLVISFAAAPVNPSANGFSLQLPKLAGFTYAAQAVSGPDYAMSTPAATPGTVHPTFLSLPAPIDPGGAGASTTPTFEQSGTSGANVYLTFLYQGGVMIWMGVSDGPTLTLPVLPSPAVLAHNGGYTWTGAALHVTGMQKLDDLLDGRLGSALGKTSLQSSPDITDLGTFNGSYTSFIVQ